MTIESELKVSYVLGFSANTRNSFLLTPDGQSFCSPFGSNILIQNIRDASQRVLVHNGTNVVCSAISQSGRYFGCAHQPASKEHARSVIWDLESQKEKVTVSTSRLHDVSGIAFSSDEKFVLTVGSTENDSYCVVWDIETGKPVSSAASSREDFVGAISNFWKVNDGSYRFISCGPELVKCWDFSTGKNTLTSAECALAKMRRNFTSLAVDEKKENVYCGTTTGDVLCVNIESKIMKAMGPTRPKEVFHSGVTALGITSDGSVVVGSGDGKLALVDSKLSKTLLSCTLSGAIKDIQVTADGKDIYASTAASELIHVPVTFDSQTVVRCGHTAAINDVCFPRNTDEIFVSCSTSDIRLWRTLNGQELLRICIPNQVCNCICFNSNGSSIVSGWADGKVRVFGPETGRLQFEIADAHRSSEVTAVATSVKTGPSGEYRLLTGGKDGQIRVWNVTREDRVLEKVIKEHQGPICSLLVSANGSEFTSCSEDGSAIFWDMNTLLRKRVIQAPCILRSAAYFPVDESQIVTTSEERQLTFWDAWEGILIRQLEVPTVYSVDISRDGKFLVTGGIDRALKIYNYEEGALLATHVAHGSSIKKVRFSSNHRTILTAGAEGAFGVWTWSST